jgi:hypothetical protein
MDGGEGVERIGGLFIPPTAFVENGESRPECPASSGKTIVQSPGAAFVPG